MWIKSVRFAKGQTRRVVCVYTSKYGSRGDVASTYYIPRSGATWKGPIGECVITVDWTRLRNVGAPFFEAASAPIHGGNELQPKLVSARVAQFKFEKLTPTFDLGITWPLTFWTYQVNGQRPVGWPLGDSGGVLAEGPGEDPKMRLDMVLQLLGSKADVAENGQGSDGDTTEWAVRGHKIQFDGDQQVRLDRAQRPLRRPLQRQPEGRYVYVRDLIEALGGTYRYDASADEGIIDLPWLSAAGRAESPRASKP